jgi:hypothetical protein
MLTRTACLSALWGKRFARTEQQKERAITSARRTKKCTDISQLQTVGVTMADSKYRTTGLDATAEIHEMIFIAL